MDLISRQTAIEQVLAGKLSDDSLVECVEECNSMLEWTVDVLKKLPSVQPEILACGEGELNVPDTNVIDCSDCIKHGGDWDCDHVHCHKGKQPDNDMIHLQKEQAYLQGWEEGRKALKEEMSE